MMNGSDPDQLKLDRLVCNPINRLSRRLYVLVGVRLLEVQASKSSGRNREIRIKQL